MKEYQEVLSKYTVFEGRAGRQEFWMFALVSFVISLVLGVIDRSLIGFRVLGTLYALAVLLPSIGVMIRRLHDIDRSGWWTLIGIIPIVGWIVLIIFAATDSYPGSNKYGPNPKGTDPSTPTSSTPIPPQTPPAPPTQPQV